MLRWLGSLKLPLAAKCELLFGAAVALVILAAIFFPLLRMEQLTRQVNERTAEALLNNALDEHVASWTRLGSAGTATTRPQPRAVAPRHRRHLAADHGRGAAVSQYGPAELLLVQDYPTKASPLARRTIRQAERYPGDDRYRKVVKADEGYRYRFGRLLYSEARCVTCHSSEATTLPVGTNVLGIATVEFPSQVEQNQLLLNRIFILIAALVAGTLGVLFFYLIISRLILQPVRVLQETAEKVSEGDLNLRTHIPSGDEFQVLSQTFNRMLENLKEGEDQLRAINQTLDLKLAELSESNLALYESNRLKSEFLATT